MKKRKTLRQTASSILAAALIAGCTGCDFPAWNNENEDVYGPPSAFFDSVEEDEEENVDEVEAEPGSMPEKEKGN